MTKFIQKILEHGSIEVLDYMGTDDAIAEAARTSYAQNSNTSDNELLIRHLMKNRHTSPFEMCEIKFKITAPIFIARQWLRHRTASINEVSGRHSIIEELFHIPKAFKEQSTSNNLNDSIQNTLKELYTTQCKEAFKSYQFLLKNGVSREQARIVLPLSTYTTFIWKIDLHNLLHFIHLRAANNAQDEIIGYTRAIYTFCLEAFPVTTNAFTEYKLKSRTFTQEQVNLVRIFTKNKAVTPPTTMNPRDFNEVYDAFFTIEEERV